MFGLSAMPASGASLLLNAEAVFTAVLAWVVFRENMDRRILLGMIAIVMGAAVLSVPYGIQLGTPLPALAILGACLCWGLDNNLTRKVALNDPSWLAAVKGAVAGPVNLGLALVMGARLPGAVTVAGSLTLGFVAYGLSLVLFIHALSAVGTARAGAYFAVAPFVGAVVSLAMGEPVTWSLAVAGAFMGVGVWLHLTERHAHEHTHVAVEHTHLHTHDAHHQHDHAEPVPAGTWHSHAHTHEATTHTHEHYPDAHHRHGH
jgi:drug/metabolite transporter (DMT)-like permease